MKRFWIAGVVLLFTIPAMAQAQVQKESDFHPHSRWTVNVNGGLDSNSDMYYDYQNYTKTDGDKTDFSIGSDIGYRFSKIFRMRLEFKYVEYHYGQTYTDNDLSSSMLTFQALDINPRMDFRVWHYKPFEFFLTTGLRLEYSLDSNEKTYKKGGTESDKDYMNSDYQTSMHGAIGGAIVKYNLNKRWGVTLNPEYTMFFNKLYSSNDSRMKRFSLNLGIEYTL